MASETYRFEFEFSTVHPVRRFASTLGSLCASAYGLFAACERSLLIDGETASVPPSISVRLLRQTGESTWEDISDV